MSSLSGIKPDRHISIHPDIAPGLQLLYDTDNWTLAHHLFGREYQYTRVALHMISRAVISHWPPICLMQRSLVYTVGPF